MTFALAIIAKSSIILISAALISAALRRSSASMRHAIWILAITGGILLPLITSVVPQLEWSILPNASTGVLFLPAAAPTVAVYERPAAEGLAADRMPLAFSWLIGMWALGVAALLIRSIAGTLAIRRLARTATPAEGSPQVAQELCTHLSVTRPVQVLFADANISPMTWGLLRHTILLPSAATEWPEERMRMVLAHELAHVKRNDGLAQIFVQIVCSVYWLNPLVWFAAHRVRIERERACDDHVLRLGTTPADYADHLVQIVRGLRARRGLSYAAVSMAQPSQLETRLVSILDSRARRRTLSRAGAALLCALTAGLTVSLSAIRIAAAVPLPPVTVVSTRIAMQPPESKPAPKREPAQRTRIGNGETVPNNAVIPPQVVQSYPPSYTNEALAAGVEGTVTLEASVDGEAKVSVLRVIKELGYGLDQKAIDAVLGWRFSPALRNGAPVQAITQIDVDFRIPPEPIHVGPGVTPPTIIRRVEPQYTDEARSAKYRGTVIVQATVHRDGTLTVNKVVQEGEHGLTEKAIEALEQWKFRPGMRNGNAVDVTLNIEVNFNLK